MTVPERFAAAARDERPDLAHLCLLIGARAEPALDGDAADAAQIELDRLAGLLPHGLCTPLDWAVALHRVLGAGHGFHGTPGDYQRLSSSLLQEVLRRRRGLPILLSVVWIEVARRAGAPVYGVALPGHFAVGIGEPDGEHVLVDPFDGGRLMSAADAQLLAEGAESFTPADPLDVVQRILNNIRVWAAPRPEHRAVQLWALDLTLLLPRHPAKLRYERAQLLVAMGDFLGGAAEMDSYAEVIGTFDPESASAIRLRARSARAHLN
ncbi:transglutaminase-like domain-containing protein [Actinacidiphila bryophytorum]|uniref:Regulator of sirC expression, contains transglutaminase-like and TPR domains n=1 Tax=Actinacidiphila bryophytorum TaxID=1436133 RepID=A0A9W4E256_9ACTN|nr:transglutaminase-like domain-containing protein [Actinacidiphila bryophytorum]MBM9440709.1 transglutaminase family protein [Actinacidiphila bryophytorum]MBN6547320.1 transglutaminase family protein [Actinacidiphila bryophytorum]CAG7603842.1 Regulator of sirC expression, contains transglutaminase-like and TPR domains [Actinacidiphila bryophytorum]